jgi:hypothetical protein
LIALGGVYGVLVMIGRLSPNMAALLSWPVNGETLKLPLLAQLASAFAGLAALVLVLSRAVREVDKRPYVAIAPVLAVFAALVHAGLRVDLSALGLSSALVAFGALAVSLLGGALIVREEERAQWIGWGLVLAPSAWLVIVVSIAKGSAPFEPSERAYMAGLFVSTLLMGAAGAAARRLRAGFERGENMLAGGTARFDSDELVSSDDFARVPLRQQSRDDISEQVTIVAPTQRRPQARTTRLTMRAARDPSWRGSRARTGVMLGIVAVVAYLAVGGLRNGSCSTTQTAALPAAMAPSGPPVVEQLNGSGRKSIDSAKVSSSSARRDHGDRPRASKSSSSRSENLFAAPSHSGSNSSSRRSSGSSKQTRAVATSRAPVQSAGLPAWGNEALREFGSSAKPSGKDGKSTAQEPAPVQLAKAAPPPPQAAPVFVPKPMFPTKASKPIEPPTPVEPPKPVKPMTMDQVLDRVEASAKAQRKKAGLGAAKQSKADEELEALITGTMKKKK